ncbi:LytR/AlgR family response regulator transcription factor [Candidatus Leptofilum sp.]|uniref:LytR/AlgR family response regulator transcription factor n=1 Tax=Candidatus Leptofilum sp. TaxID=3241576 RepID=UPI003B5AB012
MPFNLQSPVSNLFLTMHILIADDEKPARGELRYMLEKLAGTAVYHEATNGQETLDLIANEPIDVVFLDINMPGINGLAAAAAISERPDPPLIVFATAYDAHAVRAFELAALDYVVKPFSEQRLAQTMIRIRQALSERGSYLERQNALRGYLASSETSTQPRLTKLWGVRDNDTRVLVDYADILWLEADSKKVYLNNSAGERLLVRHTLKELETRLEPYDFIRIHKAYLVNLNQIAEVVPWFSGTYQIRLADANQTELPLSRQYAQTLKRKTDLF